MITYKGREVIGKHKLNSDIYLLKLADNELVYVDPRRIKDIENVAELNVRSRAQKNADEEEARKEKNKPAPKKRGRPKKKNN